MSQPAQKHIPVLLKEVLDVLSPKDGGCYIDGTFGAGGYTKALLDQADCEVLAIDQDPAAIKAGQTVVKSYKDRLALYEGPFSDMTQYAVHLGWEHVDGIVLDIGVSSMQIDEAGRGFSFQKQGPLDMRMSSKGQSAADIVNQYPEKELADLIYQLGEERRSRAISKAIVKERKERPFETTLQLADLISSIIKAPRPKAGKKPIHPATRTFQALRMAVNDELGQLKQALEKAEKLLKPGGVLAVVTFHSLEDRLVKNFFKTRSGRMPSVSKYAPPKENLNPITFRTINQRGVKSSEQEIRENVRARSARLRFGIRTEE